MTSWKKFKLLLWKNFLLQRRHKKQTVFEIASPVIFSLFLILIRCLVDPVVKPEMTYKPFRPTFFNMSTKYMANLSHVRQEGTLAFSPETPLTRKITKEAMAQVAIDNLHGLLSLLFDIKMLPEPKGYANADALQQALTQPDVMRNILVGVQFDDAMAGNVTEWPDDVLVTLRFPAVMRTPMVEHPLRASWRTNLLFPIFARAGPREPDDPYGGKVPGYSGEMFLAVQHAISQAIIKDKSNKTLDAKVYLQRYPQPAYRDDKLLMALERFISMIIMLCFAYTFVNTVRMITAEKELQLKETMTIMGLPNWLHWLAWYIKQVSFLFISVILIVILFKLPLKTTSDGEMFSVMSFTPWTVLLFFMMLFVTASLCFCFMVSVFFKKSNTAASFMGLAWFATYSVFMLSQVLYEETKFHTKLIMCLISNTALGFAFQMMIICEGTSKGLQWNMFFTPVSYHDRFQPGHVALMLVLDSVLYLMIAMYVEKIRPGMYGVPQPWYFPCTGAFWKPNRTRAITNTERDADYAKGLLKVVHDEEPQGVPIGVHVQNLTKIYKGRRKAVDNLNLRVYENEITVLLGHNGAGKTTTISMLTGTVPPTSGTATINGFDIVSETKMARKSLGICPQHNVLFPDLTVAEHIKFYGTLKGVSKKNIGAEIDNFVKLLDLEDKRHVLSKYLSGGQKRRLSVGVAMCGSSKVVLLDEPTSGLDPASRRALWDLLQREKKGRTMILTTHFMDEADVLGDRVAIMSGGRLQCLGTPYFLKRHYGMGYKLTMVKKDHCNVDLVTRFLALYVPDVQPNTNIGSELTYVLPNEYVSKFPDMLKELEEKKQSLQISSYGLSITTLEEVFMKAGAEEYEKADGVRTRARISNGTLSAAAVQPYCRCNEPEGTTSFSEMEHIQKHKGFKLLRNHIRAMFLKLAYNSTRSKLTTFIQFVSPIINICISVLIARSWKFISELPPLKLTLEDNFERTEILISATNMTNGSTEELVMDQYRAGFKDPNNHLMDIGSEDAGAHYLKLMSENEGRVRYEDLIGASFSPGRIVGWFSNYGYHDSAISLARVDNAVMGAQSPGSTITIVNHPLPYSIESLVRVMASGSSMGFQFAFNMGFCMAFVTAFIVLFIVKERISGAKLLQRVSGVRPLVLWGCALCWDWLWLLLVHLAIIVTLAIFRESTLSTPSELGRILLVLMIFSWAIIPLHYIASFFFSSPASGFAKLCFINIFTGCMPFIITEVLRLPEVGSPYWANVFDWVFSPLPNYCLCRSFRDMAVSSFAIAACDQLCAMFVNLGNCTRDTICQQLNITVCCITDDPFLGWSEPGIGRYLFMMSLTGAIAFSLLLAKEYKLLDKCLPRFKKKRKPEQLRLAPLEDSDVAAERRAVDQLRRNELVNYSLVARDLTKYYRSFLAVNRLSFAVRKAECFGLLGINGAGKTSTFRMLTGDTPISAGEATVHGLSINRQIQAVHRYVGYCPQFDALFDNLTARETLKIFCLLRGIPGRVGAARASELAYSLGFTKHFDKKVYQCSGGTKRKISTAVALLGDSPLIFLDEPTTGMDPASKRLVWTSVSEAVRSGRSVVLTSHSMEECEALCSRLTVMVSGRLHCLGSLQHLKSKFSQGYTIIVKCKPGPMRDMDMKNVLAHMKDKFPSAKLIESYLGISTFYVSDEDLPWWRVFAVMEELPSSVPIEDYSVSQTTLEQVFLQFTRVHDREKERQITSKQSV